MNHGDRTKPILIVLALLALALRIHLAGFVGHQRDIVTYQCWSVGPDKWPHQVFPYEPCNYPPLYPCILRTVAGVHDALGLPGHMNEPILFRSLEASRPILYCLKAIPILADIAGGILLFLIARATPPKNDPPSSSPSDIRRPTSAIHHPPSAIAWPPLLAAALFWFLPANWYDSAYWGQTDTVLSILIASIVYSVWRRKPALTGALLAIAVLFKAQSFAPVLLIATVLILRYKTWLPRAKRLLAAAATVIAVVALWSVTTGNTRQWRDGYLGLVGQWPQTTVGSMNVWWLLTRPWDRPVKQGAERVGAFSSDFPLDHEVWFAGLTYRHAGLAMFAALMAYILWCVHRAKYDRVTLALAAAAAMMTFAMVCTQMHERYVVPVLGPLLLASCWRHRYFLLATIVSIPAWLNCVASLPWFNPLCRPWEHGLNKTIADVINRVAIKEHDALRISIAVANVALWLTLLAILWYDAKPNSFSRRSKIDGPRGNNAASGDA